MRKLLPLVLPLVPLAIGLFWLMPLGALAEEKGTAQTEAIPSVVARVNGKEITAGQYRNQWHIMQRRSPQVNTAISGISCTGCS